MSRGKYAPGNGIAFALTAAAAGVQYLIGIPQRINASAGGYGVSYIALLLPLIITIPVGRSLFGKLEKRLGRDKAIVVDTLILTGTFIAIGAFTTLYTMMRFHF